MFTGIEFQAALATGFCRLETAHHWQLDDIGKRQWTAVIMGHHYGPLLPTPDDDAVKYCSCDYYYYYYYYYYYTTTMPTLAKELGVFVIKMNYIKKSNAVHP